MPWLSVTIETDAANAEALSDALLEAGACAVSAEDADAGTPAETTAVRRARSRSASAMVALHVACLVPYRGRCPGPDCLCGRRRLVLRPVPAHRAAPLADEDWVRRTQEQFQPVEISRKLWIVPSWHRPPHADAVNSSSTRALAFGTGTHPTTRLCLRWPGKRRCAAASAFWTTVAVRVISHRRDEAWRARALGVGGDVDADALATARRHAHCTTSQPHFRTLNPHLNWKRIS